ncbi:hypothetical protein WEI85_05165 [Actinomycetes bacterium KLBMP 9797]
MQIPWSELGQVLAVGLIAGVGVVALFAVGVARLAGSDGTPTEDARPGAHLVAWLCFSLCALAVLYGLYTLLPFD